MTQYDIDKSWIRLMNDFPPHPVTQSKDRFEYPLFDWATSHIIIPGLRNILPGVIAHEIVGVQPMTRATGLIHTLKTNYGKEE